MAGAGAGAIAAYVVPSVISALGGLGASMLSGRGGGSQSGLHEDDWILWKKNYDMQKEFAQNGLRWRVQDATNAGLHPLAALGANIGSPSPVSVGGNMGHKAGRDFTWLNRLGQDISRAVKSGLDPHERRMNELAEQKAQAEVNYIKSHNRKLEKDLNEDPKPVPAITGLGITESNLPPDTNAVPGGTRSLYQTQPTPTSWTLGAKSGIAPMGQYRHTRLGYLKYYPDQDAMDMISESVPAALSFWGDMAKYKWTMNKGKYNPNTKAHKFYLKEKRRIEKEIGEPIVWDQSWRWRLLRYHKEN